MAIRYAPSRILAVLNSLSFFLFYLSCTKVLPEKQSKQQRTEQRMQVGAS